MPRKKKTPVVTPAIDLPKEFLEKLIPGPMDAAGVEAVFQQLKKAVIERALGAELGLHLADAEGGSGNHRNGRSGKTVLTDEGPLRIDVPRDRTGTFEPQLIPKHERRFAGFDDRIVSMYARGMTVREIQGHLAEMYSVEVSPEFISKVTDEVMAEVTAWQARPLEAMYPVVFFDALRVKIREDGVVRNKAVYLALGMLPDGTRDILGLWIENTGRGPAEGGVESGRQMRVLRGAGRALAGARGVGRREVRRIARAMTHRRREVDVEELVEDRPVGRAAHHRRGESGAQALAVVEAERPCGRGGVGHL